MAENDDMEILRAVITSGVWSRTRISYQYISRQKLFLTSWGPLSTTALNILYLQNCVFRFSTLFFALACQPDELIRMKLCAEGSCVLGKVCVCFSFGKSLFTCHWSQLFLGLFSRSQTLYQTQLASKTNLWYVYQRCTGHVWQKKIHIAIEVEAGDSHREHQLLNGEAVQFRSKWEKKERGHQQSSPTWPVSIGSVWLRGRQLLYCEAVAVLYILHLYPSDCIWHIFFFVANTIIINWAIHIMYVWL